MPELPTTSASRPGEFAEKVKNLLEIGEVIKSADPKTRDLLREKERDLKHQTNSLYWQVVFDRVAQRIQERPTEKLAFDAADRTLINFGWVDERLFPREQLVEEPSPPDAPFRVLYVTEWFAEEEGRFLELANRTKLDTKARTIGGEVSSCEDQTRECLMSRDKILATASRRQDLLQFYGELEQHRVRVHQLERIRRMRSLTREEVGELGESVRQVSRIGPMIQAVLKTEDTIREDLERIHEQIFSLHRRRIDLDDRHKTSRTDLAKADDLYQLRLSERRQHMQEKLVEIREDIKLCAKWARTEAHSCLFGPSKLNSKRDVVETVYAIEDFDPTLFENRRVEKGGRPTFVITPGVGHGSYDFRTNTIVLPLISPRDRLESVAYAIALYRRDLDKVANDGKLWESFFSDQVWRGIKDREKPTRFPKQMEEFVTDYVLWVTREAKGMMVLDSEIRRWFEQNIAPDKRAPMVPRDLRAVRPADRVTRAQDLRKETNAANAYRIGVLAWQSGRIGDAYGWFTKAATLDPESLETLWAMGVLHVLPDQDLKTGEAGALKAISLRERLAKAKESMDRFVKLSKPSWWLLKAQDHLRKINELQAQMTR